MDRPRRQRAGGSLHGVRVAALLLPAVLLCASCRGATPAAPVPTEGAAAGARAGETSTGQAAATRAIAAPPPHRGADASAGLAAGPNAGPPVATPASADVLPPGGVRSGAPAQAEAGALAPSDPEARYLEGQHAFLRGDWTKATEAFRASALARPSARAWHALGDAWLAQARFPEAAAAFEEAVRLEPGKWLSWLRLGRARLAGGRASEATAAFREAARSKPAELEALRGLAEALIAAGREEEALEPLARTAGLDPANAAADHKTVGQIHARAGRPREAAEALERSAALHRDAGILNELAEARVGLGQLAEAAALYREAAALDPKDPFAWEMVGEIELRLAHPQLAREAFEAALRVRERPGPHLGLGRVALAQRRRSEARRELEKALGAATGESAHEARELATFAGELGAWREAEKLLAMLAAEEAGAGDATLWLELARARQALGRPDVAQACARARALTTDRARPVRCPPPKSL